MAMMDVDGLAEVFWEQGYLLVPGFGRSNVMNRLDTLIHDHFGERPDFEHTAEFVEKSKADVVPWFPQRDGETGFDPIADDPGLHALTEAILGEGYGAQYCMVMFSAAGTGGQSWHQDCPPEDPGQYNLNRLIYTRDITEATGGQLVVVPGSHRFGELPSGDPTAVLEGQRVLSPKCGDLVLVHGHVWHRVLPTATARASVNYRAGPAGTPEGVTDVCVYRNMRYRFSTAEILEERV